MIIKKSYAGTFAIVCLLYSGLLPLNTSSADLATVFKDGSDYIHDDSWPREPGQFHWGVDEGIEPDLSLHATGIALDKTRGLVYALVRSAPHVRVFTNNGTFVNSWSPAKVGRVHMVHVDQSGNIWIADNHGHTVTQYTPQGKVMLSLGTFGEAGMDETHFNQPTDISTTADGETVFISDGYVNKRIVKFDRTGKYLGMWGGSEAGIEDGQFVLPHSLTVIDKKVYVADREGARVQVFDLDGNFLADWRDTIVPWAIESIDKYILVAGERLADGKSSKTIANSKLNGDYVDTPVRQDVLVFNDAGEIVKEIELPQGNLYGQVNWLHAIDCDHDGSIFLADVVGNHVQKWKAAVTTK